nr:MAG TPA: hypothetical protein [Microviridae sp.]
MRRYLFYFSRSVEVTSYLYPSSGQSKEKVTPSIFHYFFCLLKNNIYLCCKI